MSIIEQSLLDIPTQTGVLDLIELPECDLVEVNKLNDEHWVTKHNELIQSTYKLSLQQQRILLIIASRIQPKDENFKLYQFNTKDIIDILGLSSSAGSYYTQIKSIVNDLQTKTLTIKTEDRETNFTWVITSDYFPKQGFFQVELHPKLKPYFLELKDKFTQYRLENVLRLSSSYSIRMYELLKQYESIRTRRFGVDELKELLAIEPEKYKQYGHFKSKILLHSQEQIEKHTDLRFEFKEIKTGRKITKIEFFIKSKNANPTVVDTKKDAVNDSLIEIGISLIQIKKIRDKWDDEQILRNLAYTQDQIKKKRIDKPAGYFIRALTEDYGGDDYREHISGGSKQVELLNGTGVDHREKKYGRQVIDFEAMLISTRDIQRELGLDEEIIQEKLKEEVIAFVIYQFEHYKKLIEPEMFTETLLSSYCEGKV
ncbi:replication initiation protein (plasmid) [Sporosarcina psychrophila]|uniref:replication initiation protein n=1 Tax=Sporosarcina psychrophila TaxID=1476 RepID=UPI0030CB71C1